MRERNDYRDALAKVQRQHEEAVKEINQAMAVRIKVRMTHMKKNTCKKNQEFYLHNQESYLLVIFLALKRNLMTRIIEIVMPKYWGKLNFSFGSFPEVGPKLEFLGPTDAIFLAHSLRSYHLLASL